MPLYLPDGTWQYIHSLGSLVLPNNIKLNRILYTPTFTHNLISVQTLAVDNDIKLVFYPDKCVFQDLKSNKILGIRKAVGKLYLLDKKSFVKDDSVEDTFGDKAAVDRNTAVDIDTAEIDVGSSSTEN